MSNNRKKTRLILLEIAILTSVVIGGTAYYYLLYPQFRPSKKASIYIDRDDTPDSVYTKLQLLGNPRHLDGFRWMARWFDYEHNLHTGHYVIRPGDSAYRLYNRLSKGRQEPVNLTIGSVRTLDRLARSIGKQLLVDSAEIAQKLFDKTFQQQLGYTPETMACLFLPETYQVYWNMSVEELFARMQKEHRRFWNDERLAQAQAIGMTPEEVTTLASIVEEETNNAEEKPMVAGLYINRLDADMPLQADPTIRFALQDFTLRRVSNELLRTPSPYNTYLHTGLPPGPIRIPTPQGINSVLNYHKHNYLYMCAKEDFSGTHNFSSNYNEHLQNAKRYWKALNDRRIFN